MSANGGSPVQTTGAAPTRTAQEDTQKLKFKLVWPEQPDKAVLKRRITPPPAVHVTCSKEERDNLFVTISVVGHSGPAEFPLPNDVLENSKGEFRFKDEYRVTFAKLKFNFTSEQLHVMFKHLAGTSPQDTSNKSKKICVALKFSLYKLHADQSSQLLKEIFTDRNKPIRIVSPGEYLDKKPELDHIIPKEGPYNSENDVVLLGSFPHMPSPYYVFFGESCVSVSRKGKEFLHCKTPAHSPATVQVRVRCGHTETQDDLQYTFLEPTIPSENVSMTVSPAPDKETREFAQAIHELSSVLTISTTTAASVAPALAPTQLPTIPSFTSLDGSAGVDELVDPQAGFTRLFYSSFQGKEEAATHLLNRNANVNRQDADGYTPLHWAVFGGHLNLVRVLLERGADMTVENCEGFTPVHIAACMGSVGLLKELLTFCRSHHTACAHALKVNKSRDSTITCVEARNKLGETPLHYAACGGWHSAVEYLLESGANPNIQNGDMETPLHWAARQGWKEVCELFIKWGCSRDTEDADHHKAAFYLQALGEQGSDGKRGLSLSQEMDWESVEKIVNERSQDSEAQDGSSKPRRRSRQPKPKVFDDAIVEPLVTPKRSRREKRESTGVNLSQQVADQLAAIKDRTKQPSVFEESLEMFVRIRPPSDKSNQSSSMDDSSDSIPTPQEQSNTTANYVNEQLMNLKFNMQSIGETIPFKNSGVGTAGVQVVVPTYPNSIDHSDQPLVGAPPPLHTNPAVATFLTQPKSHLQAHRNVKPIPTIELNDQLWTHISFHAVDMVGNMELVQVVTGAGGAPKELIIIEQGFLHGNKVPVESRVIKFNHLKLNKKKPIDQIVIHKNVQDYFFQLKFTLPGYEPVYSCSFKIIAHISQMPGYVPMRPQNAHPAPRNLNPSSPTLSPTAAPNNPLGQSAPTAPAGPSAPASPMPASFNMLSSMSFNKLPQLKTSNPTPASNLASGILPAMLQVSANQLAINQSHVAIIPASSIPSGGAYPQQNPTGQAQASFLSSPSSMLAATLKDAPALMERLSWMLSKQNTKNQSPVTSPPVSIGIQPQLAKSAPTQPNGNGVAGHTILSKAP